MALTGTQIITKFEQMVEDVLDTDFTLQLLNDAKNEIEAEYAWEQLKKEQTISVTAGSTLDTNYSLASDFAFAISLYDSGYIVYNLVPFEERRKRRDQQYAYVIDYANTNLQLLGQQSTAQTFYLYYISFSDDIAAGTSWVFPDRFHYILPLKMAELYYAVDAGEKARAWDDRWSNQYERGLLLLKRWDAKMKLRAKKSSSFNSYNPKGVNLNRSDR